MQEKLNEIMKKYSLRGDGETNELGVESSSHEGDLYIRDFTKDTELIEAIEELENIYSYTEFLDGIENDISDSILNELNCDKNNVETSYANILYNDDQVFCIIFLYYLNNKNNNGNMFDCKTINLMEE